VNLDEQVVVATLSNMPSRLCDHPFTDIQYEIFKAIEHEISRI
jgi:hypothetical protein